jgi:antitoxin ParD1/3/4
MSARKLSITLPEETIDAIESRVEAGRYGSTDEAMLAAVDALLREENESDERIEIIRQKVRSSLDDPRPSVDSAGMRAHLDQLYARHKG